MNPALDPEELAADDDVSQDDWLLGGARGFVPTAWISLYSTPKKRASFVARFLRAWNDKSSETEDEVDIVLEIDVFALCEPDLELR